MIFSTRWSETSPGWAASPAGTGDSEPEPSTLGGPQMDLGPGLSVAPFRFGRFANAIQKTTIARHALQAIREDMTSSFILILEPDGSAAVCRGWRYLFFNDGPEVQTSEQIREQLGYRGQWEQRGEWVHVDLTLDDKVCLRVSQYSNLVPNHAPQWHLRCLPVVPTDHPILTIPALACRPINAEPAFGEDEPHLVAGILPGQWLVLGRGNGLRIKVEANSLDNDELPNVQVEIPAEPVETDAWENSF